MLIWAGAGVVGRFAALYIGPRAAPVVDGYVTGRRYVSDVVDLFVGQAVAPFGHRAWSR